MTEQPNISYDYFKRHQYICDECDEPYVFNTFCGADICPVCKDHRNLARCFCGWSLSGRDGYAELLDWGETIEEDDY